MIVVEPGHTYALKYLDAEKHVELVFVRRDRGDLNHPGTTSQEVLQALIDRVKYCDGQLPHVNNTKIIDHLRMAFVLFEARALERKVEKGLLEPEYVSLNEDGHFLIEECK